MSDGARFDPRFDPAFQPGYVAPPTSTSTTRPAQPPAVTSPPPAVLPDVVSSVSEAVLEDVASARRLNPFVVALGVVSLSLVLGGLYMVLHGRQLYSSTGGVSEFNYVTFQVVIYGAPLMIALGIATAIGILFLFATRWRSR